MNHMAILNRTLRKQNEALRTLLTEMSAENLDLTARLAAAEIKLGRAERAVARCKRLHETQQANPKRTKTAPAEFVKNPKPAQKSVKKTTKKV